MEVRHRLDLERYGHIAAWNKPGNTYPTRDVYRRAYRRCRLHENPAAWSGSEQYLQIARRALDSYRQSFAPTIEEDWRAYRAADHRPDMATSRAWHSTRLRMIAAYRSPVFQKE